MSNQLDDILLRLEALEKRIAALESGGVAQSGKTASAHPQFVKSYNFRLLNLSYDANGIINFDREAIKASVKEIVANFGKSSTTRLNEFVNRGRSSLLSNQSDFFYIYRSDYQYSYGNHFKFPRVLDIDIECVLLSDGKIYKRSYKGDDLNAVKAVATLADVEVPKGTRKEKLAAEIIKKYGGSDAAIVSNHLLKANGAVSTLTEMNISNVVPKITSQEEEIRKYYNEVAPLKIADGMSTEEKLDAINNYMSGLSLKNKPASAGAQAEAFERVAKEVIQECGYTL